MEKKISYRQLEKQNKNGRELLHRVTLKASNMSKRIETLEAVIRGAESLIGYLAKDNPNIERKEVSNYLNTKQISWEVSDTHYKIIAKDREPETETVT